MRSVAFVFLLVLLDGGGEGKIQTIEDEWGVAGSCRDFIAAISGDLDHRTRLNSDIQTLEIGFRASKAAEFVEIAHLG